MYLAFYYVENPSHLNLHCTRVVCSVLLGIDYALERLAAASLTALSSID